MKSFYHSPIVYSTQISKPIQDIYYKYMAYYRKFGRTEKTSILFHEFCNACENENKNPAQIADILRPKFDY